MTTDTDPMAEIRGSFFVECEELIEALQDGLETIEKGGDDAETINVVFRAVHSIKGGAGAFGLEDLVRFAHSFEAVLDEARSGRLVINKPVNSVLFRAADHLSDLISIFRADGPRADAVAHDLISDLEALIVTTASAELQTLDPQIETTASSAEPIAGLGQPKSVVRVDLDRIETLVNLVGELVINQSMLSQSLEQTGLSPHSDTMHGLDEFQRLTRDIQDSVMMIRAQPIKPLFQRMSRVVREVSAAVGKEVRLVTSGDNIEIDKIMIEKLTNPLTHMIRNAIDHGLETTADRLASGKPAQGTIHLCASHRSGRVIIEVMDDGGGIDHSKIVQIAMEKGLIPQDASLSKPEIENLLFLPGFSSARAVTDFSGRGVGMDVVQEAIQALGGRIKITSEPGRGTAFSISLPLTLAVLDGMVIEVANQTLVLPLSVVIESVTLRARDVEMVGPNCHTIKIRNNFVPILDLGHSLGFRDPVETFDNGTVMIIGHEDGSQVALLIDDILDQRQVVIKGLNGSLCRAPGIAAATILGDGKIALIFDPADLMKAPFAHLPVAAHSLSVGAMA